MGITKRVAVLTTTGGGAATVVDLLGARGIDLITAPDPLRERLAPMGITLGTGPVIDVTMAGTRREVYLPAIDATSLSPSSGLPPSSMPKLRSSRSSPRRKRATSR